MEPRNWFQGIDSTSLCPCGLYNNPIPARFLAPFDCSKVYKYGIRLHWIAELVPWNRFLGSFNVYKYELRLHWLAELVPWNRFLGFLNVYKYGLRLHWIGELVPWNRFLSSITWRMKTKTIFFGSKRIYSRSTMKGTKNNKFICS
jgi:hypothetical protein